MRVYLGLAMFVCARWLCAQEPPVPAVPDPVVVQAQAGLERLRSLVEAGAAPRAELERAEEALADAQDASLLRRTLYGPDLTEEQAGDMIAAARRKLERRRQAYAKAQQLVAAGVATQLSLGTFLEEIDRSRKECDLAESRARLLRELAAMARAEQDLEARLASASMQDSLAERFDGSGLFTAGDFQRVESAFSSHFAKPLPVSALGETAVHRALGFDHRNRVDVAVHPDQPEGVWLRQYLLYHHIPFFAFRQAVPGSATGAHIHIGPMSTRLASGG